MFVCLSSPAGGEVWAVPWQRPGQVPAEESIEGKFNNKSAPVFTFL